MKKLLLSAVGLGLVSASFADFFPFDSLIVTRANGATNSNAAATVDLVGFDYAGAANGQVFSLGAGFTQGASATAEGMANASANYLALAGYNAPAGTATPSGTSTSTWLRKVAVFDNSGAGSVAFTDLPTSIYNSNAVRSAFADTTGTVLTAGNGSGWQSTTGGVATALGTTTNTRVIKTFNGVTYGSTGSGTVGVYSLTAGAQTLHTATNIGTSASPYDFEFYTESGNDYLFVADDRSVVNGGGLQVFKNGAHVRTIGLASLRSLAVRQWVDAGVPKVSVFGIAAQNTLVGLTFDVGTIETTTSSFSTLFTAPTGSTLKSVIVVPEPASMIAIGLGIAGLAARRRRASK